MAGAPRRRRDRRRIRGVRPRGLIEANVPPASPCRPARASAGYAPAASLKRVAGKLPGVRLRASIRGVRPRGLIEARFPRVQTVARATSIRGVRPRGLIEAWRRPPVGIVRRPAAASAGYAPAASLKHGATPGEGVKLWAASAGYAPAASLKPVVRVEPHEIALASAGYAPAASLKRRACEGSERHGGGIRGVRPRGLIEAQTRRTPSRASRTRHPRGTPPRPH